MKFVYLGALLALLLLSPASVRADVSLPAIFSDHMVLQQKQPIRVWGWGEKGEAVEVSLGESSVKTEVNEAGKWEVKLPQLDASLKPLKLVVKGKNQIEFNDVDAVYRTASPPALEGLSQTRFATTVASTHHGHLVTARQQSARHLVGTDAC